MKPLRQTLQATLICVTFVAGHAQSADQVKIDSGIVQGATQNGVISFKGICR